MTRARVYGSDTDFMDWVRRQPNMDSRRDGFVVSDCDCFIHRYMRPVDGIGTREIQALMFLEVKTRNGDLTTSQQDTLSKVDIFKGHCKKRGIRHFGVSVLRMSDTSPDDSSLIQWGRFRDDGGNLQYREITREQLIGLMLFDLHPDNLTSQPFRRHHKTREIMAVKTAPLGFSYEKPYLKRS